MKRILTFLACVSAIAFSCLSVCAFAEENEGSSLSRKVDQNEGNTFRIEEYPSLEKAMKLWETKRAEALANYLKKLNAALTREKNKGDLDFIQGVEKAIEKADTQHKGPCIVRDRLPQQIAPAQAEMNEMKARLNKAFVAAVDREISIALSRKENDKAEQLTFFLYRTFLPENLKEQSTDVLRLGSRLYLFIETRTDWQSAYQWCRDRNGDLATIDNNEVQARLYQHSQKTNLFGSRWIGGVKIANAWQWTDGTPFQYTAWAGRPSNGRSETVLAFGYGPNGTWDDTNPLKTYNFIAQWTLY